MKLLGLMYLSNTDAQCTSGVELMLDGQLIFDGNALYRPAGDSFIVSCKRCNDSRNVKWLDSNEDAISVCDGTATICVKENKDDELVQHLMISSFNESSTGEYKCTKTQNGTLTFNILG